MGDTENVDIMGNADVISRMEKTIGTKDFPFKWEQITNRTGRGIIDVVGEEEKKLVFLVPALGTNWMKYDAHIIEEDGLYKKNKQIIIDTIAALKLDKNRNTLSTSISQASQYHFEAIQAAVFNKTNPTYYYFPPLSIRCNGQFSFNKTEKKIVAFNIKVDSVTPSDASNKNYTQILKQFSASITLPQDDDSNNFGLYNYQAEFYSSAGGCGIIKLKYIYTCPDEISSVFTTKNNVDQRYTESIIVTDTGFDKKDLSQLESGMRQYGIKLRNGETMNQFKTGPDASVFKVDELFDGLPAGSANPTEILQENNTLRNDLEVLYFFNDDRSNYQMNQLKQKKGLEDAKNEAKDNAKAIGAAIFQQINDSVAAAFPNSPEITTTGATKEMVDSLPQNGGPSGNETIQYGPSGNETIQYSPSENTGRTPVGLEDFSNTAALQRRPPPRAPQRALPPPGSQEAYGMGGVRDELPDGPGSVHRRLGGKRRPMFNYTNPFFKRTNMIGKYLTNLRKMRKKKPSRARKTKRNNKSKRRNKKSKRRL